MVTITCYATRHPTLAPTTSPTFSPTLEPTSHPIPVPTPLRADEAAEPLDPALALSNAPQTDGTAFVVPKVIGTGEEG